jgi:hypothetical protein
MTHLRVLVTAFALLSLGFGAGSTTVSPNSPMRQFGGSVTSGTHDARSVAQAALGTIFTYQGRLVDNGSPGNGLYDLQFTLFDAETLGIQVGSPQVTNDVSVDQGLFTVALDFGARVFKGDARWLEVAVRPGASTGPFTTLTPRQPLTPAPYALALPGLYTVQNGGSAANLIGGYSGNSVSGLAVGGTIAGGGAAGNGCGGPCSNRVTENYATVRGGFDNQAGNGNGSATDAAFATVAGGAGNTASVDSATVSGGNTNQATGHYASVGGGWTNLASGYAATVPEATITLPRAPTAPLQAFARMPTMTVRSFGPTPLMPISLPQPTTSFWCAPGAASASTPPTPPSRSTSLARRPEPCA